MTPLTPPGLFADSTLLRSSDPAFIDDHRTISWSEAHARVAGLAAVFAEAGLRRGDCVALLSTNRAEFVEAFIACVASGLQVAPINWHLVPDEISYILKDSGARAIVADETLIAKAVDAIAKIDSAHIDLRIVTGMVPVGRFQAYEPAVARTPASPLTAGPAGGVMFYTSGTTGKPKGVLRHDESAPEVAGLAERGELFCSRLGIPDDGVSLVCGPLYHTGPLGFARWPVFAGRTTVLQHGFDAAATLQTIDTHRVTTSHMVPTQFVRFLLLPEAVKAAFDGSSLVAVLHGGAPCPPELKRQMVDWWGPKLIEYYGATETLVISMATSQEWLDHPGTVGRPVPDVEVLVLDDDGAPLPAGQTGQLYIRSRTGADFEYHGDPAKTAAAHGDTGALTVGDVGHVDEDGYIYITDRKTDMIISGGANIYPAEIEAVLTAHPKVLDAAVVGVPDPEFGERAVALVELAHDTPSDALRDELVQHCRERLAGYKVPKELRFDTALPRTAAGKMQKKALQQMVIANLPPEG